MFKVLCIARQDKTRCRFFLWADEARNANGGEAGVDAFGIIGSMFSGYVDSPHRNIVVIFISHVLLHQVMPIVNGIQPRPGGHRKTLAGGSVLEPVTIVASRGTGRAIVKIRVNEDCCLLIN